MSTQISDADGGWWNLVGNGYSLHNHLDLVGKVIATVDCVIIAESKVLLIKRGKEPHKDKWAFPGGRIEQTDENILSAAIRELKEETHLQNVELKYIKTIGNNSRDPRGFCLTNVFLAQLDKIPCGVRAGDDAVDYTWFSIYDGLPEMAFDHKEILQTFIQM
jgi:8-oxo-dGTP diphosphatase